MQQLNDKIVLMPFADGPQHGGQPVAQSSEPSEPVEPSHEIAVPSVQPDGSERGADSGLGLLAGCWRIVGLVAACSHQVPPRWRQLAARFRRESSSSSLILLVRHLAAHAQWESPSLNWPTALTTRMAANGTAIGDDHVTRSSRPNETIGVPSGALPTFADCRPSSSFGVPLGIP